VLTIWQGIELGRAKVLRHSSTPTHKVKTLNAQVNFNHPLTAKLLFDGAVTSAYRNFAAAVRNLTMTSITALRK
jgi:hypothetical protein